MRHGANAPSHRAHRPTAAAAAHAPGVPAPLPRGRRARRRSAQTRPAPPAGSTAGGVCWGCVGPRCRVLKRTWLQLRPMGQTLIMPLRNSTKVPRFTGMSSVLRYCEDARAGGDMGSLTSLAQPREEPLRKHPHSKHEIDKRLDALLPEVRLETLGSAGQHRRATRLRWRPKVTHRLPSPSAKTALHPCTP